MVLFLHLLDAPATVYEDGGSVVSDSWIGPLGRVGSAHPPGDDPRLVLPVHQTQVGGVEGGGREELGVNPWPVVLVTKQQ